MTQDGHHPQANGGGSNGHANGGTGSKGGGKESLIRDGLSPEEQAAVDKEMARHGPRVQAWPLHRSKVVYFVRHAEALHNEAFKVRGRAAYEDPCFVDPELTALGVQQCRALKPQAARVQGSLDLLVVSPLRRTLETALHTFDMLEGTPWVAHELVRERIGRNTCDRRRPLSVIKTEHPAVDFSHVEHEEDELWTPHHRETPAEMARRGMAFLQWLGGRGEERVAVVTHSAFLLTLFTQVLHCHDGDLRQWFENAEMRSVTLHF